MSTVDVSSADFFEAKYQKKADPWDFASSPYELGRYAAIIAALAHRRYQRAFEPGCSVGVLTEQLASICDAVDAIDFSQTAVKRARKRCAAHLNVVFVCASIAQCGPFGGCDLIVLSEVGYYFSPQKWRQIVEEMLSKLKSGAIILAAHWLGTSTDHRISGDQVHEILQANSLLSLEHSERNDAFRLDRWVRA
jgi:SAM-dependent methyltransferase